MTVPPGPVIPCPPFLSVRGCVPDSAGGKVGRAPRARQSSIRSMSGMERSELAKRIHAASHLTGEFTLRSGAVSNEYFDKYRFEADPALLHAIAAAMAPMVP